MKTNKIKIAHIVIDLNVGGLETLVVDIINNCNPNIFHSIVICLKSKGDLAKNLEASGFKIITLEKNDKFELKTYFKLAFILIMEKINVVHCHNFGTYIYGAVSAILAGFKKTIYTEHGRIFPDKPRRMLAERILSFFTYKIVAVSKNMQECLVKYEKISPTKTKVIYNAVDQKKFKKNENNFWKAKKRISLGIGIDDFIIGHIGRLVKVKDQATLLKAFKLSLTYNDYLNEKLLLIGDGPEKQNLEALANQLNISNSVIFTGTRTDIVELINIMDVFVLSSLNEGISLTILQALACGVPVVATNVGGNIEIINNGSNGFLCQVGNTKEMRECIKKAGKLKCISIDKKFLLENMIHQYESLYSAS